MTKKKYKKISDAFNTVTDVEEEQKNELALIKSESKELTAELKANDYESVRNNMKEIIGKGGELFELSMKIAEGSEEPRSLKVAADIFKVLIEANGKLMDIHIKKNIIEGKTNDGRNNEESPTSDINISGSNVVVTNANDLQTEIRRSNGEDVDKMVDMNDMKGGN